MPDHVDAATPPEEAADNIVSLPTDNPFSAMEKSLGAQGGRDVEDRRARRLSVTVLWTMAVVIVVVDQLSKQWALFALSDGQHTALLGRALGLVLVRNPGAAFSFATGQTWIFALIASLVVVIIVRVSRNLASRSWAVALGLVLGGAVGNLIDRLLREPGFLRGHVIDFIDYGGYFVGNVADIAIVLAAAGIIVLSLGGWEIDVTRAGSRSTPEPKGADGSQTPARAAGAAVRQGDAAAPSMPAMPVEPE